MKKTLVALAALATVGAAFAQSSVTLYGRIDASLVGTKATATSVANVKTTTADTGVNLGSGASTGSRWGLKGSEDLGGGLKVNFQLENGFDSSTGALAAIIAPAAVPPMFGRVSTVGVSGGFGSIDFGRTYTPYDNVLSVGDPHNYSNFGGINAAYTKGIHADVARQSNAINYNTPDMGGLAAQVMYAFGENAAATGSPSQSHYVGFNTTYKNGPIAAGFAYEKLDTIPGAGLRTDAWTLTASYDLGVARIGGGYERAKQKGLAAGLNGTDKGWHLGVSVPLGAASLQASYGRESTNGFAVAAANSESRGGGVYISYPLSKRTALYAGYLTTKTDFKTVTTGTSSRTYAGGMVHNF